MLEYFKTYHQPLKVYDDLLDLVSYTISNEGVLQRYNRKSDVNQTFPSDELLVGIVTSPFFFFFIGVDGGVYFNANNMLCRTDVKESIVSMSIGSYDIVMLTDEGRVLPGTEEDIVPLQDIISVTIHKDRILALSTSFILYEKKEKVNYWEENKDICLPPDTIRIEFQDNGKLMAANKAGVVTCV